MKLRLVDADFANMLRNLLPGNIAHPDLLYVERIGKLLGQRLACPTGNTPLRSHESPSTNAHLMRVLPASISNLIAVTPTSPEFKFRTPCAVSRHNSRCR